MKRLLIWLAGLLVLLAASGNVSGQSPAPITVQHVIASGFDRPLAIVNAGDGSNRLFIVEQRGKIKIIKNGVVLAQPFLDLTGQVSLGGEQGLLGLAFHPQYKTNGYFFIYYTDQVGVGNTVVARYKVSNANPDLADPASKKLVLYLPQPYANHNGGTLAFGKDGYLYIGLGDGGSGGDPQNNGQSLNTMLGKILRIDINTSAPYLIPLSNPFVGVSGAKAEIWAYGLRNPWKFSFDRATGDLYIGDVGQNQWEEVDFAAFGAPPGLNYGWRCMEGNHAYNSTAPCNDPLYLSKLTPPVAEYSHTEGASVTGGVVYRGILYPALRGRYYYADVYHGKIWSLYRNSTQAPPFSVPVLELTDTGLYVSAFGEDEAGEVYLADLVGGTIRRLESAGGATADLSTSTFAPQEATVDRAQTVLFTITLENTGGAAADSLSLSNPLPDGLAFAGGLSATSGAISFSAPSNTILWAGSVPTSGPVTLQYNVTVENGVQDGSLINRASLSGAAVDPLSLAAVVWVPKINLATSAQNFYLPGTQAGGLSTLLQTSLDCDICHAAPIYDRWRGSVMSQAGRDPLLWSALAVSNAYAPGSGEYCLRCHTNRGWLEGRSTPADGSGLNPVDLANGVACLTCHRMVDVVASPNDEASSIDSLIRSALAELPPLNTTGSAMLVIDPNDNRRGPFSLPAAFSYHTARRTDLLSQSGSALTRSRMCGGCHNVSNPLLSYVNEPGPNYGEYWPNPNGQPAPSFDSTAPNRPFPLERTFDEWRLSDYANGGVYAPQFAGGKPDGIVEACQDCHMTRVTGKAADNAFNPIQRDCLTTGCLPQHDFLGANTWLPGLLQSPSWRLNALAERAYLNTNKTQARAFLTKAATMRIEMGAPAAGSRLVTVTVINQTGHKLPTGYPEGRRMWINLKAYDSSGSLIYESGAYNAQTGVLTLDPAIKIYEAKLGISPALASQLKFPAGESFFFSLNNTWIKDNRIPPRGYNQAAFDQDGLRPVGAVYLDGAYSDTTEYSVPSQAVKVIAFLYYQTASKEYIDFLRRYAGVDGFTLGNLWDSSRSEPVLVTRAFSPAFLLQLPFSSR